MALGSHGLLGTIGTSYIADERMVTSVAGLGYRRGERERAGYEISGEGSGEYRSGLLRHTRLRLEGFVGSTPRPGAPFYYRGGAFAETTSFGGEAFSERARTARLFGGGAGTSFLFGTRQFSVGVEGYGGVNRPETLGRMPELARRAELRSRVFVRVRM